MPQTLPASKLFLFEPQPACQKIILDLNLPNSILIPKAVSSKTTQVELYTDSPTYSLASLHQRQESNFKNNKFTSFAVDTITINEIISEYNLEYIDFIKIDIEGHELEALKGAAKSLASGMIKALAFEFGSGNLNSRTFFRNFWNLQHIPYMCSIKKPGFLNRTSLESRTVKKPGFWGVLHKSGICCIKSFRV